MKVENTQIEYRIVQDFDTENIVELFRSAGWWRDEYNMNEIPSLIRGSFIFAVAINKKTGHAIAMGRILSDRSKVGYIQDLCVLTKMRGQKVGIGLLRFLVKEAEQAGLSTIHLVAEPKTLSFYEKAGFIFDSRECFLQKIYGVNNES